MDAPMTGSALPVAPLLALGWCRHDEEEGGDVWYYMYHADGRTSWTATHVTGEELAAAGLAAAGHSEGQRLASL
jgi:hypothetical protein